MKDLPFTAVIPAAGFSRRTYETKGVPKLLYPVLDKPWIHWQLSALAKAQIRHTVIILGYHAEELYIRWPLIRDNFDWGPMKVWPIINPFPERGPFTSLQCGLHFVKAHKFSGPVLLNPVDVPVPPKNVIAKLNKYGTNFQATIPVYHGKRGHPVALNENLCQKLSGIHYQKADARLDLQLKALPSSYIKLLEVDTGLILENLNHPRDFAKLTEQNLWCPEQ